MSRKCDWCGRTFQNKDVHRLKKTGEAVCFVCFHGFQYEHHLLIDPWLRTGKWEGNQLLNPNVVENVRFINTETTSISTHPNDDSPELTRCYESINEEMTERATLSRELRKWARTDDELRGRLGGVDLATAPLEILRDMLDKATDLLGPFKHEVAVNQ
jgi:hypothetical protein